MKVASLVTLCDTENLTAHQLKTCTICIHILLTYLLNNTSSNSDYRVSTNLIKQISRRFQEGF